jgi:hypothetical protein
LLLQVLQLVLFVMLDKMLLALQLHLLLECAIKM